MEDLIEAYLSVYENVLSEMPVTDEGRIYRKPGSSATTPPTTRTPVTTTTKPTKKSKTTPTASTTPDAAAKRRAELRAQITGIKEEFDSYDVILNHLLDEGFADTEQNAITIMANMSEAWIDEILDEAADNVIMTVKSPSGQERSKVRKGAWGPSDSHRHEKPEQIANRRFSQQLADRKKEREERMRAGRLTVATKRGIERATNKSDRTDFTPGSALRANERDEQPTDYRARRRRASGR